MNATTHAAWSWFAPSKSKRLERRRRGEHYGARPAPGLPPGVANAHARFECAARGALREWLMV